MEWLIAYEADRALKAEDFADGLDIHVYESTVYHASKELWLSLVFLDKGRSQLAVKADIGRLWVECRSQERSDFSIKADEIVDCEQIHSHILGKCSSLALMNLKCNFTLIRDDEEVELCRRERVVDQKLREMAEIKEQEERRIELDEMIDCAFGSWLVYS